MALAACTPFYCGADDRLGKQFWLPLYLWSILLALCRHVLPTPVPGLPAAHLPTPERVTMLSPLGPVRKLYRRPRELVRWQLAIFHTRIYGSTQFRDIYVPERHY